MRYPYSNLFGSCLLAALILPSQQAVAGPSHEAPAGLRTNWNADSQIPGRSLIGRPGPGIQILSTPLSNNSMTDGLQEGINANGITGPTREPMLGVGRLGAPASGMPAAAAPTADAASSNVSAADASATGTSEPTAAPLVVASTAQAATLSEAPATSGPSFSAPAPSVSGGPSAAPGSNSPASGFSAPRPAMPQALSDAVAALTAKKPDDAIRLARTFISQADAKGPGPENTPPIMGLAHEIVGTALAVQSKPDEAMAELQKAVAANPNQGSAFFKMGMIYREQNKLPEAKAALEKASGMVGGEPVKLFLGDVNERLGDIPAAIQIFEPMLSAPQGQELKFKVHLASLYDRVNRFADAIKLLQPLVKADSKDPEALTILGFAYAGSGKPKEGIPLLLAAKALQPDNWRIDLALGTAQRETGDFDAAQASLAKVVAAEPKQVQARFQLALAQMGKSQFAEAADTLAEALKLAPTSVEVKQLRGDALFRSGKKDEAIALFKELTTRDGVLINDYVNLARAYQASDKLDDAAATYRQATQKFQPVNPVLYALLAGVQAQQKKFPEARETIAQGRKLTPDDLQLLRALIQVETTAGDFKAALPVAQHLVDIQPKSLDDRFTLGTLYGRLGDRKRAISIYRAMLTEAPDNAVVLNNLAAALTDDGDAKSALPYAKRAQEMQPKSPATNDTLGWALLKSGQPKDALPLFETATQGAPNNPELLYHLAMAQKASNNTKAARSNLEKALAINGDFEGSADAKAALATLPK
jgi:tetratricopeptide (TPR) repeat protein